MNRVSYRKNMDGNFLKYLEVVSLTLHKKTIKSKENQYINWSLNFCYLFVNQNYVNFYENIMFLH